MLRRLPLLGLLAALLAGRAGHAAPFADLPDLVVDGRTLALGGRADYDEVVVRNGGELRALPYAGVVGGGVLELHARRIVVEPGARISADAAGWRGRVEGKGEGPGGGEGGAVSLSGTAGALHATGSGAGAGYGGRGGDGIIENNRGEWLGGRPYGTAAGDDVALGSAGGAPPPSHHETASLRGGNGGGALVLVADEVVVGGEVSADGEAGQGAEFDAAGGGAGGAVLVDALRLDLTGRVSASGGAGGPGVDIGGSGGGGRVKVRFTEGDADPARIDVSPGRGPCPGEAASPWGCEGTVDIRRRPPARPVFLPLVSRGACLVGPRRAVALVLDTSQSMSASTPAGRPAITAAVEAAEAFLGRLAAGDRAALVTFDAEARVVQPLTADIAAARDALHRVAIGHGSRLDAGLALGAEVLAGAQPTERRVLVVVTDGVPSLTDRPSVLAAAAAARAADVHVYALGFGAEVDAALLGEVTGDPSRVLVAPDAEGLDALYLDLGEREACPSVP